MNRPSGMGAMVLLAASFVFGVGLGNFFPVPLPAALPAAICALGFALLCIFTRRRSGTALALAALCLGWIRVPDPGPTPDPGDPCDRVVEGTLISPPESTRDGRRATLAMESGSRCLFEAGLSPMQSTEGRLFVHLPPNIDPARYKRGDRFRLRGRITPLLPRRAPGAPRTAQAPAYRTSLRSADALVRITASSSIRHPFDSERAALAAFLDQALPPIKAAEAKALLLGETAALPFAVKTRFRRTGCAHLLAVSGLHLGLAAAFAFFVVRQSLLYTPLSARGDPGRLAAAIALLPTVGFTLLTGARTPVVRACIMVIAALTARVLQRPQGSLEAFFIAAAAILCAAPQRIQEAGFQLSFAAVGGFFFVFSKKEQPTDTTTIAAEHPIRKAANALLRLFRGSLSAWAASTPIALYHFGAVSWVAPFTNLVAVPLTALLLMPLLLIAAAVQAVSPSVATWILKPVSVGLAALDALLGRIATLPCTIEAPGTLGTVALWGICAAVLAGAAGRIRLRIALLVTTIGVLLLCLVDPPPLTPGILTLHFFDVGQGDAALISTPNGRQLLVDAGPAFRTHTDAGERIVVPALRALGVTSLTAAATHPDADHIGGIPSVIEALEVTALYETGHGEKTGAPLYTKMMRVAASKEIPTGRTPTLCAPFTLDGVRIEVLHPCDHAEGFDPLADTNDNSLVILLTYGRVSLLLLGDASSEVEKRLIESGRLNSVDVLKLSHHGSRTGTSALLLDALSPAAAVISVGRYNRFGMPHRTVLQRLRERHISTWRTDRHGTIRLRTDGRAIELSAPY